MNCKNKNAKKGTPKAMGVGNTKKIGNLHRHSQILQEVFTFVVRWGGLSDDIQTAEQVTALSTPSTIHEKQHAPVANSFKYVFALRYTILMLVGKSGL